jgi:hypothetical protein
MDNDHLGSPSVDARARKQKDAWKLLRMNKGCTSMMMNSDVTPLAVFFELRGLSHEM